MFGCISIYGCIFTVCSARVVAARGEKQDTEHKESRKKPLYLYRLKSDLLRVSFSVSCKFSLIRFLEWVIYYKCIMFVVLNTLWVKNTKKYITKRNANSDLPRYHLHWFFIVHPSWANIVFLTKIINISLFITKIIAKKCTI